MFDWFEKRLDPFPLEEPVEPAAHAVSASACTTPWDRGSGCRSWRVLVASIAIIEVSMFAFLGKRRRLAGRP